MSRWPGLKWRGDRPRSAIGHRADQNYRRAVRHITISNEAVVSLKDGAADRIDAMATFYREQVGVLHEALQDDLGATRLKAGELAIDVRGDPLNPGDLR
jgi:hypothetical protein